MGIWVFINDTNLSKDACGVGPIGPNHRFATQSGGLPRHHFFLGGICIFLLGSPVVTRGRGRDQPSILVLTIQGFLCVDRPKDFLRWHLNHSCQNAPCIPCIIDPWTLKTPVPPHRNPARRKHSSGSYQSNWAQHPLHTAVVHTTSDWA